MQAKHRGTGIRSVAKNHPHLVDSLHWRVPKLHAEPDADSLDDSQRNLTGHRRLFCHLSACKAGWKLFTRSLRQASRHCIIKVNCLGIVVIHKFDLVADSSGEHDES